MGKDSVSLFEVGKGTATLTLDGKEYAVRPLTIGDTAKAQAFMREQRIKAIVEGTRGAIPIDTETRAAAIAAAACAPISIAQMLSDVEAEGFLLASAIGWTYKKLINDMPSMHRKTMSELLTYISNLRDPDEMEPVADPTDKTAETSIAPTDGTKSSPPSATTTS